MLARVASRRFAALPRTPPLRPMRRANCTAETPREPHSTSAGTGTGTGTASGKGRTKRDRVGGDRRRRAKPESVAAQTPSKYATGVFVGAMFGGVVVGVKWLYDTATWYQGLMESGKVRVIITYALLGIKQWLSEHPDVREKLGTPPLMFDEAGIGISVHENTAVITLPAAGRFSRAFITIELVNDSTGTWTVETLLLDCVDGSRLELADHLPRILKVYNADEYMARWEAHQKDQEARAAGKTPPSESEGFSLKRLNDLLKPDVGTERDERDYEESRTKEIEDKGQSLRE